MNEVRPIYEHHIVEYRDKYGDQSDYFSARYAYLIIDGHKVQLLVHHYANGTMELKYH